MTAIIDTHTFLWVAEGSPSLSRQARDVVTDLGNQLLLSIANPWEIAIKVSTGKLSLFVPFADLIGTYRRQLSIGLLDVSADHLVRVSTLPQHHRDPFDRMIVAQALVEGLPVVSADPALDAYGVNRIW